MIDTFFPPQVIGGIAGGLGVMVLFYLGSRKKLRIGEGKRMGINLSTDQKCPTCGDPLPAFRRPKNFRQMMWGGWRCAKCGSEFDKWLKPTEPRK
jgi:ribosomal protein L37AE/L43A